MRAKAFLNCAVECPGFALPPLVKAQYEFQWPFISPRGRTYIGCAQAAIAAFIAIRYVVAFARGDLRGRDRLAAAGARAEAEHRDLAHRREQPLEPRSPRCALSPADDRVADLRVLAGLGLETLAVAEDAEQGPRTGGRDEDQGAECDERDPSHAAQYATATLSAPTATSAATPARPGLP